MSAHFADRLDLVLKALSIGRGRLASELGVDKSLVTRWLAGTTRPTPHNLERLTRVVAVHAPGFTMLDWEVSADALAARLGVRADAGPANSPGFDEWLGLAKLREAAGIASASAAASAGFWRSIAPMPGMPGQYGQSFLMSSPGDGGAMRIETAFMTMRRIGWAVVVGGQFFTCVTGVVDGYLAFGVFNRVALPRLEVMDGIFLGCMADNGGVPIAMPCVMDRVGDLTGDAAADALTLDAMLAQSPLIAAHEVGEDVRRRLDGATGGGVMMMAAMASLARGATA